VEFEANSSRLTFGSDSNQNACSRLWLDLASGRLFGCGDRPFLMEVAIFDHFPVKLSDGTYSFTMLELANFQSHDLECVTSPSNP